MHSLFHRYDFRRVEQAPADRIVLIQITTSLLLALTTLMFCFRLLTRLFLSVRKLGIDELFIALAYVSVVTYLSQLETHYIADIWTRPSNRLSLAFKPSFWL